ncbi:hypothetical protein QJS04_geneDACA004303 [Acorus gramineus]|uniref:Uncharacterized protein n=1 Tax=Acorus gramineus TaxID=55184 RepID=A0AAV9B1Z0_ACOGR|nr:hypothetical protein QJS04_geneDACA004303 [Acorus gramineus]
MSSSEIEWEVRVDDGFVYKRRRRNPPNDADDHHQPPPSAAADGEAEERIRRREIKKRALKRVMERYRKELDMWESLSSTLADMKSKIPCTPPSPPPSPPSDPTASTSVIGPSIDELLLQVDTQAALIGEMGNLCDVAEAMVAEKEEMVTRSLLELPVWGSPRDLVAALNDGGGGDDDLID